MAVGGLITSIYIWFATAGTFEFRDTGFGHYYDPLADAFLAGQLDLRIEPSPELLALPDPYDPEQLRTCRCGGPHDVSYYNGKFYLYFGPVPALIHAAWKALTGLPATDSATQMLYGLGGCIFFWLIARRLRDRAFPGLSDTHVLLVWLCYALGGVALYLQARPVVYHEAVLAGSFFSLGGLYFWLRAIADGRHSLYQMLFAGFLFGCAVGSRTTAASYPLGVGLVLLISWLRAGRRWSEFRQVAAFCLPLAASGALLLVYNYARFGSLTEFGLRYQLTGSGAFVFDPRISPQVLAAYVAFVPEFLPFYPFTSSAVGGGLIDGVRWWREPPFISVFLVAPLVLLAPLSARLLMPAGRRPDTVMRAFVMASGIGFFVCLCVLATWTWVTGRFMQDFLPQGCLLGGLGFWWLQSREQMGQMGRITVKILGGIILIISLVGGLGFGISQLNQADRDADLRLAYRFDSATASTLQRVAPAAWPAVYLANDVRARPQGIFYPEEATLMLPARLGESIRSLEVESLFPTEVLMTVELDGQPVFNDFVVPGRQELSLQPFRAIGLADQIAVRLRFPDDVPRPAGLLWPVRVGALKSN